MTINKMAFVKYEMWKYRYLLFFLLSLVLAAFILTSRTVGSLILEAREWSYFGAFLVGIFYTYSLSSMPAGAAFFLISKGLNPFLAAALGGLGSMLGDLVIFKLIKSEIFPEAKLLAKELKLPRINSPKAMHVLHKIAPFIGAMIIASPLPDEIGTALFGIMDYDTKNFMAISWLCNSAGLLIIALLSTML